MERQLKNRVHVLLSQKGLTLRDRWEGLSENKVYARDYKFLHACNPVTVIGLAIEDSEIKDKHRYERIKRRMEKAGIVHPPDPKLIPAVLGEAKQKAEQECKESGCTSTPQGMALLMERHLPEGIFAEATCVRLAPYKNGNRLAFRRDGRYLRVEIDLKCAPDRIFTYLKEYLSAFGGLSGASRKRSTAYHTELDLWDVYHRHASSGKTPHALAKEDKGTARNASYDPALHLRFKQLNDRVKKAKRLIRQAY